MKIRNGFVSNSSSSSFVICTKENTLEESLLNNYEEIIGLDSIPKDIYANKFFTSIKEDWVRYLCNYEDNSTTWKYEIPNPAYCTEKTISDYCWEKCKKIKSYNSCIKEKELDYISTLEDFEIVFNKKPPENIVNLLNNGFKLFNLEIYSDGDGGNILQQHSRFTFPEIDTENIKIFIEDKFY
jgi:hypothetical protein